MTRQVTIVCGPPCAGKTTWVRERAQAGDLVVDYDDIAQSLGSARTHGHHPKFHRDTERIIAQQLDQITLGKAKRAWVIRSFPAHAERERLAQRIGATSVVLLDDSDETLQARAWERPNRYQAIRAIEAWRSKAAAADPEYARPPERVEQAFDRPSPGAP